MNFKILCFCWSLIFLTACSKESNPTNELNTPKVYFSLQDFFQSEIDKLQSKQVVLHKYAFLNGKTEKKALHEIDWKTEFGAFLNSDINKPAWKDSYKIDSSANLQGQKQITYTALKPDLRTQKIAIHFGKDGIHPTFIQVVNQSKNPIYDATENLKYEVEKGYTIENEQQIMWMEKDNFKIEGELFFPTRSK